MRRRSLVNHGHPTGDHIGARAVSNPKSDRVGARFVIEVVGATDGRGISVAEVPLDRGASRQIRRRISELCREGSGRDRERRRRRPVHCYGPNELGRGSAVVAGRERDGVRAGQRIGLAWALSPR